GCGGLLSLFMGFSVISMFEIIYFSIFGTWRLFTGTCWRKSHNASVTVYPKK
ncbi:hypothetical protein L9F63_025198, partial [Diploptera punctata]